MEGKLKFPMICKGCKRLIKDEYDLWDSKNRLCDNCSMKQDSTIGNKPIRTYLN